MIKTLKPIGGSYHVVVPKHWGDKGTLVEIRHLKCNECKRYNHCKRSWYTDYACSEFESKEI
ncbi:MAG: hypothetical protein PVF58_14045 [Candidatus Methanofastidiosia archaeon]